MAIAIKSEGVSKAYQLGEIGTGTLSRDIERWVSRVRGKEDPFLKIGETNDRTTKGNSDVVWSLKDINFEIEQGDAVGIIGKNGAGKSTLLKILSRVTSPTTGKIKGSGRIASLLEVGTGFHPELTGRENIYLNGAILGMRKREITRKFDEIVAFAGVERYIDTPVKRYSSGMYVRLAFAVAAHLDSEILIVDEVLAVGDAEFQKKCLGKMGEVSKGEGRTVLFVSHNMSSVINLCNKGIVLTNGSISLSETARNCVNFYQTLSTADASNYRVFSDDSTSILKEIQVTLKGKQPRHFLEIKCNLKTHQLLKKAFIAFDISDSTNTTIMQAIPSIETFIKFPLNERLTFRIDLMGLVPNTYWISTWIGPHNNETYCHKENAVSFEIVDSPSLGRTVPHTYDHGFIVPESIKL